MWASDVGAALDEEAFVFPFEGGGFDQLGRERFRGLDVEEIRDAFRRVHYAFVLQVRTRMGFMRAIHHARRRIALLRPHGNTFSRSSVLINGGGSRACLQCASFMAQDIVA
jgi:hypothetical protein